MIFLVEGIAFIIVCVIIMLCVVKAVDSFEENE
jgi:hypothetical protein